MASKLNKPLFIGMLINNIMKDKNENKTGRSQFVKEYDTIALKFIIPFLVLLLRYMLKEAPPLQFLLAVC